MALTREEKDILKDIRDKQDDIRQEQTVLHTLLLGANGAEGLVDEVKSLARGHGRLKRNFWMLTGILVGSGIIGTGYGILNGGG